MVPTYLRRIDTKVDGLRADMVEVKQSIGCLEEQYASISRRVDRIGGDVERIKSRLDLVDVPGKLKSFDLARPWGPGSEGRAVRRLLDGILCGTGSFRRMKRAGPLGGGPAQRGR